MVALVVGTAPAVSCLEEDGYAVSCKAITYVPVSEEELVSDIVRGGRQEPVARQMASFDLGMKAGLFGPATDAFGELTGKKPTSVLAFLDANRGALHGKGN